MDPTDKELKELLAKGPLVRNGFDDRLRKRIEDSLDRPRGRSGRPARFTWRYAAAAAGLMLALVVVGLWQVLPERGILPNKNVPGTATAQEDWLSAAAAEDDGDIQSALLLGLRKDVAEPDGHLVSTYRTVLIAPEDGQLTVAAEGPGIVMPYKQTFWRIESTVEAGSADAQGLIAYQAYGSKALTERPAELAATPREGLRSERLLYVGKEYVSVAMEPAAGDGTQEYRFVKTIKQLAQTEGQPFDPQSEPHTDLETALALDDDQSASAPAAGSAETDSADDTEKTEQWAIARKPGQWVGVTFAASSALQPVDPTAAQEVAETMPNDVVPEDRLLLTWEQIRSVEPSATDAYTYNDLLATVSDREVKVYPYKQKDGLKQAVSLQLEPDETIVMVEWALNQSESKNYADQWKTKVAEILSGTAARA